MDRPGNITFINNINATEMPFPDKPYAAFVAGIGVKNLFVGKEAFFTVTDRSLITAKVNVVPLIDPGTGSIKLAIYQCG